jgi:hypothetical protein
MVQANVSLYLISRQRIARLEKIVRFPVLPRTGEFVKVTNREKGDYFAFTVVQVTHRESRPPELWLKLIATENGRSVVSFIEEDELDDYVVSYRKEGWTVGSVAPNRTVRPDGTELGRDGR